MESLKSGRSLCATVLIFVEFKGQICHFYRENRRFVIDEKEFEMNLSQGKMYCENDLNKSKLNLYVFLQDI